MIGQRKGNKYINKDTKYKVQFKVRVFSIFLPPASPRAAHLNDIRRRLQQMTGNFNTARAPAQTIMHSDITKTCSGQFTHCPGRPLRINFMSRYICFSQIGPFDVCFEKLFSKAQNPGGFFRKIVF